MFMIHQISKERFCVVQVVSKKMNNPYMMGCWDEQMEKELMKTENQSVKIPHTYPITKPLTERKAIRAFLIVSILGETHLPSDFINLEN
jgi:hypothetical protein